MFLGRLPHPLKCVNIFFDRVPPSASLVGLVTRRWGHAGANLPLWMDDGKLKSKRADILLAVARAPKWVRSALNYSPLVTREMSRFLLSRMSHNRQLTINTHT
ncbi:hypothetical protein CEXT_90801 [Caerostris extrusa]|uniref:F-box domain-containing protein n=1 Tax=Caerostris extrusa TaxID=172846 RepID=A0AAV4P9R2_CAEEX|nr:hypothetical protein CEXT_90801 [Caerostris extrusa]